MTDLTHDDLQARVDELETRVRVLEQQLDLDSEWPETDDSLVFTDSFGPEDVLAGDTERNSIIKETLDLIKNFESAYGEPVPIDHIIEELADEGHEIGDVLDVIDKLRRQGDIYEPVSDCVKVV